MNEDAAPADRLATSEPSHEDRRTGLILFGVLQILLGLLCLGMAALIPVGQMMTSQSTGEEMPLRMLLPSVLVYAVWGVMFLWLGIGSTQCRRWARALTLVLSWSWLILGIVMVPMMAWMLPKIMSSVANTGQKVPQGMMGVIIVIQLVFMALFFIALPGAFVLFYRSRHVKATCEARDPIRRWTDNCPLPLLAITCLTSLGALCMLAMPLANMATLPLFGSLVTGLPGALLMIGLALFLFWIAWSFYRLKIAGWWALLAMIIVFGVSNVLTWTRIGILEFYEKLDYPQSQIDMIEQQGWLNNDFLIWSSVGWILPPLIYLLWVKRLFRPATP